MGSDDSCIFTVEFQENINRENNTRKLSQKMISKW
jgi:hypothetical protein